MSYTILHHRLFEKEVQRIPSHHQQRIYRILASLAKNPTKLPPNTTTLRGYEDVFRTRIGDFRLIFQINHKKRAILVLGVGSRGNVYKLLRRMLS